MISSYLPRRSRPLDWHVRISPSANRVRLCATVLAASAVFACCAHAQVITIDTSGKNATTADGTVDRRYQQIEPTHVELAKVEINPKTRTELLRLMQAEQGFAMRPLPRGHKGLILIANGKLEPAGEAYLNMVIQEGLCAKPGDRVVISDVKFERNKMIFEFNGGPDLKHRILRHVEIGGSMGTSPVVQDDGTPATGSRLTLEFRNHVPEMTGADVKALLAPLISFDVKTPVQAFTDTLPPQLKQAILSHQVLVGMSTDMVLFAKGQPNTKSREMDGQMPFDEWIYGTPPEEVDFVRINGNRVIRVEVAKEGQPLQIFTKDVVSPMMLASGSPELAEQSNTRTVREGDVERDPNKEAPAPPPSLRKPGEQLPNDNQSTGVMRPVQFPKPHPQDQPGYNPDEQSSAPPANGKPGSQSGTAQPSPQNSQPSPPGGSQPQSAPAQTPSVSGGQQQPAGTSRFLSPGAAS